MQGGKSLKQHKSLSEGYKEGGGSGQKIWLKGAEKQEPLGDPGWNPLGVLPSPSCAGGILAPFLPHSLCNPPEAQIPVFHKGNQQAVHLRESPKEDAGQGKIQAACGFSEPAIRSRPSPTAPF